MRYLFPVFLIAFSCVGLFIIGYLTAKEDEEKRSSERVERYKELSEKLIEEKKKEEGE